MRLCKSLKVNCMIKKIKSITSSSSFFSCYKPHKIIQILLAWKKINLVKILKKLVILRIYFPLITQKNYFIESIHNWKEFLNQANRNKKVCFETL